MQKNGEEDRKEWQNNWRGVMLKFHNCVIRQSDFVKGRLIWKMPRQGQLSRMRELMKN